MNEIFWPEDFIPGFTDNFVSNEVIVAGLSATDVWPFLNNAPLDYDNGFDCVHDYSGAVAGEVLCVTVVVDIAQQMCS